jgi:pyruvate/oxaloacetate carboxyltransferase
MDSMKDLLNKKALDIDFEKKKDEITLVDEILKRHFKTYASASKITDRRVVHIKVPNSSMSSEVRMTQMVLIEEINRVLDEPVKGIRIRLR